jgi:alpha-glucosidase
MPKDEPDRVWWRDGVLYQIYPRSYADTNADGVGDLPGIAQHLDHLEWLGVDGIWLNPTMPSPNDDWGYDVSDYCGVHPALGTLADLDALVDQAGQRGIRVLLDLVPNHSSDQHPWFVDARSSRDSEHRDWYVWVDGTPDTPPNNWRNSFDPRRSAWTWDDTTGQWYLNQFLPSQPDLNWWNPKVRDAFDDILRFWFDRGIAGFRIDVAHSIVKDKLLRDNPPATKEDHWYVQLAGLRPVYNACRPEVHDVLRRWHGVATSYDPHRILVGETYVLDPQRLAEFYGAGDELDLAFNFLFLHADFDAAALREAIEHAERLLPGHAWPVWTGGNHDNHRWPTRWCGDDPLKVRAGMVMLMSLRGTPFVYYGDEIGMPDTPIPDDRVLDPVGRYHGPRVGRDAERTPMPWNADLRRGAGFSAPGVEPWLPYGAVAACNVADQRDDPTSMLTLTRDLIALRRAEPALRRGAYRTRPESDATLWAWDRGDGLTVAINFSDGARTVAVGPATIVLSSRRERDGSKVDASLELAPWEAVIIRRS